MKCVCILLNNLRHSSSENNLGRKENATMPVHLTQEQLALRETQEWLQMNQNRNTQADYSSL